MADNVILNAPTTTGATIATDEVGAAQHQLVKLEFGGDGVATMVSESNPLPSKEVRSVTPTQTSPAITDANTSILSANSDRLGATIYNEGAAVCYTKLGTTASTTSYTLQIASGGYFECPFNYTGAIDGITASGTAQLRVTEII